MIELTPEQRHELAMTGWPPLVVNPTTQQTFVLLPVELFERVQALLAAEDAAALDELERASAAGVEEKEMPQG